MSTSTRASPSKVRWITKESRSQPKRTQPPSEPEESSPVRVAQRRTMGPRKMTLQSILEKPERSSEDAKFLYRVVKDMPFFADFNKKQNLEESDQDMLINLCKNVKYEKYAPTDVIFKEDQPSDGKFYIVLKGIVYVVQSAEKTKSFFEEQNRKMREGVHPKKKSGTNSPQAPDSRKGSLLARRNSLLPAIQTSRRNSLQVANSATDKDSKKSLKLSDALTKLKDLQRSHGISDDSPSLLRKNSIETPSPLRKTGLSRFKYAFAQHVENKGNQVDTVNSIDMDQEKIDAVKEVEDSNTKEAENIENKEEKTENKEENGETEAKEEINELNEATSQTEIQGSNSQQPAKLKNATGRILKMVKLKGVFGSEGKKGVTLQERVTEYGVYRDKIEQGGAFGHAALQKGDVKRNATMIAASMVELLVIQKEDLQVIREHFYKTRLQMKEFLLKYFPYMDNVNASKTIESYLYLLREDIYNQGAVLCQEGTKKDKIFIIFEGKCQLMKTFTVDQSNNHRIHDASLHKRSAKIFQQILPISLLERGAFIGEETLFNQHEHYEYTAKVISPRAVIYSIDRNIFEVRFPRMTFEGIRQMHLVRQANHVEVVNSILKTKYPSMNIAQNQETYETGDEAEERDMTQLKPSNEVFANPIVVVPPHDPLHKNAKNKVSPAKTDTKWLKNKLLEYSHGFYVHGNENGGSNHKLFPQAASFKSPRETQSKLRLGLSDAEKTRFDELKSQLQDLQREEKHQRAEQNGAVSSRDTKYQNNQRRMTLRNQGLERSPVDQYMKRALDNFNSEKKDTFIKHKNLEDIDDYRLGFGRDYEVNRKLKGWESARHAKEEKIAKSKQISPGILNIIDNFARAKDKSQKFDSSFHIERAKISGISNGSGKESPKNHFINIRRSKPTIPNITLESIDDHRPQYPSQSIESPIERDNSYGFMFVTSPKQDTKRSIQFDDARSFAMNTDISKRNTDVSKRDTDVSKENKGGAVVQNLVRKYQAHKALSKPSKNSKVTDRSSLLLGTLTPTSFGIWTNQSDTPTGESLPAVSSSYNIDRYSFSESYKI